MNLKDLFENVPDIEIESLMPDSRKKRPNSIFFCHKGMMHDGHKFVNQAIENGAKVIVHSEPLENKDPNITYIKVKDVTATFNHVADAFYGYPSHHLMMFGVTGTNGKSSIACIIRDLMDPISPTGYIGTIAIEYGNVKLPPLLTTPDIDDLHGILKDMIDAGIKCCSLEASSIGIDQRRVESIDFDVAIFTNLTHDHLDYHGTIENYFEAKKHLFDSLKPSAVAVTNMDDPKGMDIVKDTKAKVVTYGVDNPADYQITSYQLLSNSTKFTLHCNNLDYEIETNLIAKFNLSNLLAAITALNVSGVPIEKMIPMIGRIRQIEGRMERIMEGQPFNLIVDFAHTPDGIIKLCEFASAITPRGNRIIGVTGSAGKRDTEKRKVFGSILDQYADMIILTEDDPRDERVSDICNEISTGINDTPYSIIEDRYDAIRQAVELADKGDTIIVMGKGDEKFMYRREGREPYRGDDVIAREVIHKYYFGEGDDRNE
ncbi:MAG: UDP-N-acetylmuramoyl-L-alanyl-D-glutamate--2,6-diaminopimelate ligase [Solobacterium sp.]|nr:UDP-N-acetylmuramoyl-L-alanyl-D-glutamate--2,6-diaminopimelate ligase [Solobacterium sp.]